jgi:hypothetical protein
MSMYSLICLPCRVKTNNSDVPSKVEDKSDGTRQSGSAEARKMAEVQRILKFLRDKFDNKGGIVSIWKYTLTLQMATFLTI